MDKLDFETLEAVKFKHDEKSVFDAFGVDEKQCKKIVKNLKHPNCVSQSVEEIWNSRANLMTRLLCIHMHADVSAKYQMHMRMLGREESDD